MILASKIWAHNRLLIWLLVPGPMSETTAGLARNQRSHNQHIFHAVANWFKPVCRAENLLGGNQCLSCIGAFLWESIPGKENHACVCVWVCVCCGSLASSNTLEILRRMKINSMFSWRILEKQRLTNHLERVLWTSYERSVPTVAGACFWVLGQYALRMHGPQPDWNDWTGCIHETSTISVWHLEEFTTSFSVP